MHKMRWGGSAKVSHKSMWWFFSCLVLFCWKWKEEKKSRQAQSGKKEKNSFHKKKWFFFLHKNFSFSSFAAIHFIAKARKNYGEILFISKAVSVFVCWEEKSEKKILWVVGALYWWGAFFFSLCFFSSFYDSFRFFSFSSANTVSRSHTTITRKYTPLQYLLNSPSRANFTTVVKL